MGAAGEQTQADAITSGERGPLDLPVEDDELLAEQGVFGQQDRA